MRKLFYPLILFFLLSFTSASARMNVATVVGGSPTPAGPIAATKLDENYGEDQTVYTTASISPTGNYLILIGIVEVEATGEISGPTSVVGNGITYTLHSSYHHDAVGEEAKLYLYRGMAASPTTGTVVITFPDSTSACLWGIVEFSNVNTSGTNGSGAIQNTKPDGCLACGDLTVTLDSAFSDSDNRPAAVFGWTDDEAGTQESGWIKLYEQIDTTGLDAIAGTWDDDSTDNSAFYDVVGDRDIGGIIVELKHGS